MPKYYVDLVVRKIYNKQYDGLTVYADNEDHAEEKAVVRAEEWAANADDVIVEVLQVNEE